MFITGHDELDADHARLHSLWDEFCRRLASGDCDGAAAVCQHGLHFCLDHWTREEVMLAQTEWPQPIIQCHLNDHEQLERSMVCALTALNGNRHIDQYALKSFARNFMVHMATFDLPLAECLCRRTARNTQRQP
jgi:hemerythrin